MPASLPGATLAQNNANPTQGQFVIFDPLSGPKGSPLDVRKIASWNVGGVGGGSPVYASDLTQKPSTGMMSTGIGIGANYVIGIASSDRPPTPPGAIFRAGFNDNMQPGLAPTYAAPPPNGVVASGAFNSTRMYIGGGRTTIVAGTGANGNGAPASWRVATPTPYTANIAIVGAGNGGSRDGGAGPAFSGFALAMMTATGPTANGAVVEAGWVNRSGIALALDQSVFASSPAALGVAA